jgi:hypothetical protein
VIAGKSNLYIDYFTQLQGTHEGLDGDARDGFITLQMENIRQHLVEKNYDTAVINEQLALARDASRLVLGPPNQITPQAVAPVENPAIVPGEKPETSNRFSMKAVAALLCVLVLAYTVVLVLFVSEGKPQLTTRNVGANAVPVDVQFVSVDLVRDTATLLVTPVLSSPIVAARGKMIEDITIEIDTGTMSRPMRSRRAPRRCRGMLSSRSSMAISSNFRLTGMAQTFT